MENKNKIPPNTFPKAEKLKSRKAIDGLFKNGKAFFIHPYKVFFQMKDGGEHTADDRKKIADSGWQMADSELENEDGQQVSSIDLPINLVKDEVINHQKPTIMRQLPSAIQVGFAVSTKNFKHAVDRNRIKRLGREAYRLNKHQLVSHLANQHFQLQVFFCFYQQIVADLCASAVSYASMFAQTNKNHQTK